MQSADHCDANWVIPSLTIAFKIKAPRTTVTLNKVSMEQKLKQMRHRNSANTPRYRINLARIRASRHTVPVKVYTYTKKRQSCCRLSIK